MTARPATVTTRPDLPAAPIPAGKMTILGLLPNASNTTLLAEIGDTRVVYKPDAGERPLWDFPAATLSRREVAAYRVSQSLGWDLVPPTELRDGPEGMGSAQLWVDHIPGADLQDFFDRQPEPFAMIAVFDALINNADRKFGHVLVTATGELWCIDHGVSFHVEPKLRTVIWAFAGQKIPPPILSDLNEWLTAGQPEQILCDLLAPEEVEATTRRAASIVHAGRFPATDPNYPSIPWPPW